MKVRVCLRVRVGMKVGGEGNCEGEENKAGQCLGICVSAAVEYFQLT